ncbi:S-layer domain-containing protein [Gottschalkia purinilytica]|uniref:S-layer domain-containing protein n=1 Tax=Gottschalkia purinilytica TaxID=1503 RepID=A0A0L0WE41_GOTPU|nr:S-layer homology domain-containing protein [Gottschalkia purinilytica]KNF09690.1 S-layer domain-containing protein [Gottschalkia purinilytica]
MNRFTKKLFVLFTALSMLLLSVPTFAEGDQPVFKDVPANHWASEYIEALALGEILTGYSDGTFKPEKSITRAEFTTLIVSLIDEELSTYEGDFTDVKAGEWHANYIATAVEYGLIAGYSDETFKPNKSISRAEMAVIMSRLFESETNLTAEQTTQILSQFKDNASIPSWAKADLAKVVKSGLISGMSKTEFSPNSTATRAQAATVIYRAAEIYGEE